MDPRKVKRFSDELEFSGHEGFSLLPPHQSSVADPIIFSLVPVALLLTTLLAAAIPARRASRIDRSRRCGKTSDR